MGSIINQMIDGRQAVAVEEEESQVSTAQTKSRKKSFKEEGVPIFYRENPSNMKA